MIVEGALLLLKEGFFCCNGRRSTVFTQNAVHQCVRYKRRYVYAGEGSLFAVAVLLLFHTIEQT
jgi:hypothetical protein